MTLSEMEKEIREQADKLLGKACCLLLATDDVRKELIEIAQNDLIVIAQQVIDLNGRVKALLDTLGFSDVNIKTKEVILSKSDAASKLALHVMEFCSGVALASEPVINYSRVRL